MSTDLVAGFEWDDRWREEWPALFVLDELVPVRVRLLLAAAAGEHESTAAFPEYLRKLASSAIYDSALVVDDWYCCPPATEGDASYRRFLRLWLGGKTDILAASGLPYSQTLDVRADLARAICHLRFPSFVKPPSLSFSEIHPMLERLSVALRWLDLQLGREEPDLVSGDQHFSEDEHSPLLLFAWAKRKADEATKGHVGLAVALYERARYLLGFCGQGPDVGAMRATIEACMATALALHVDAASALLHLEPWRQQIAGMPGARPVDDALRFHRFRRDLVSDSPAETAPGPAFRVHDPFDPEVLNCACDRVAAAILTDDESTVRARLASAANLSLSQGSLRHSKLTQFHEGVMELGRSFGTADDALGRLVESTGAGSTLESKLKQLPLASTVRLGQVTPQGIRKAWDAAQGPPGDRVHRISALAQVLARIAGIDGLEKSQVGALADVLVTLAEEPQEDYPTSNLDHQTPAISGIKALASRSQETLLEVCSEERLVKLITSRLEDGSSWSSRDDVIEIVGSLASSLSDASFESIFDRALGLLEKMQPGRTFWPWTRYFFPLVHNPRVLDFIEHSDSIRARFETEVLRICFSQPDGTHLGFEHGFALSLASSLNIPLPPVAADIVDRHIQEVRDGSSSAAAGSAFELILNLERLDGDKAAQIVPAVTEMISVCTTRCGKTAVSSGHAAGVVFEISKRLRPGGTLDRSDFRNQADRLLEASKAFVSQACRHPAMMAPFSFPSLAETDVRPVIVFNWGYAILSLSAALGRLPEAEAYLGEVLGQVAVHPMIRAGLYRARSEFAAFGRSLFPAIEETGPVSLKEIEATPDGHFYDALPGWLSRLVAMHEQPQDILVALLRCCMELGPSTADLGVLTLAASSGVTLPKDLEGDRTDRYLEKLKAVLGDWTTATLARDLLDRMRKPTDAT